MFPVRVTLSLLLVMATLAACQPVDVGLLAEQIEAQVTARTTPAEVAATRQSSATAAEPSQTATPPPTQTLTTDSPSLPVTPSGEVGALTTSVTDTLEFTATDMTTPVVITTTTMVTRTWEFREVRVAESGRVNQAAWVGEDLIGVAASTGLYLYQSEDLALVRSSNLGEAVLSLAYIPGEQVLAWGDFKGDIHWIDPQNGEYLATTGGHRLGVTDLVQAPGSAYLVSGSDDGSVRTWVPSFVIYQSVEGPAWFDLWQAPDRVTHVAASAYPPQVAAGSYRRITVWNLDTGERSWESEELAGWVGNVGFSPDGWTLGAAEGSNHLKMWSTGGWLLSHDVPIEGCNQITALDFGPEDFQVVLGCKNGALFLLNGEENTLSAAGEVYPSAVTDVVFHPEGARLLAGYQDGMLRVWSVGAVSDP